MYFKNFLQEVELNVGIDPQKMSAADAINMVKQKYKMGAANPARAIKQKQQDIASQEKELKANPDDPLANDKLAIKALEQKLARMKIVLARKEEQLAAEKGETSEMPGVQ